MVGRFLVLYERSWIFIFTTEKLPDKGWVLSTTPNRSFYLHVQMFIRSYDKDVLDWLAKSLDINIIEHVCGFMV